MEHNVENQDNWFDPSETTLGDRIAGARERAGMTVEEFAKRLGQSVKQVERWENDKAEPRAGIVPLMAGLLKVSLRWLVTGTGDGGPRHPSELGALGPEIRAEIARLRGLQAELDASLVRLDRMASDLEADLAEARGDD